MISIKDLRDELDSRIINPGFTDLEDSFHWFSDIVIEKVDRHYDFTEENYCRVPLIASPQYDLLLCCWTPGQLSPFHGHPEQGCLVKILKGTLTEAVKYIDGRTVYTLSTKSLKPSST